MPVKKEYQHLAKYKNTIALQDMKVNRKEKRTTFIFDEVRPDLFSKVKQIALNSCQYDKKNAPRMSRRSGKITFSCATKDVWLFVTIMVQNGVFSTIIW